MAHKINFDPDFFTVTETNGVIEVSLGDTDGNITLAGTYNGPHLVMRGSHLWVDATGDLRVHNAAPSGDTSGVVVGSQS